MLRTIFNFSGRPSRLKEALQGLPTCSATVMQTGDAHLWRYTLRSKQKKSCFMYGKLIHLRIVGIAALLALDSLEWPL